MLWSTGAKRTILERSNFPPPSKSGIESLRQVFLTAFPQYQSRFAVEDIEERLRTVICTTVRSGDIERVLALMKQFWERLDNPDERKVCLVPLQGISMDDSVVEIGSFTLRRMDAESIRYVTELLSAAIDNTSSSERIKAESKSHCEREFAEHLKDTVCVAVYVSADSNKASQIATKDTQTVLDLIRFTTPALYPKSRNITVSLKGDGMPGIYRRYVLPIGKSDGTLPTSRTGPFGDFQLNRACTEKMEKLGVISFAQALGQPLTPFQNAIRSAIHWFAESQVQKTPEYELLSLIIAVETLFATEVRKKILTDTICEAVAVFLNDAESEREEMFAFLRDGFRWRGDVAHAGKDADSYTNLKFLRGLVHYLISTAMHRMGEFQSPEAVLSWVKAQKPGLVDRLHPKKKKGTVGSTATQNGSPSRRPKGTTPPLDEAG